MHGQAVLEAVQPTGILRHVSADRVVRRRVLDPHTRTGVAQIDGAVFVGADVVPKNRIVGRVLNQDPLIVVAGDPLSDISVLEDPGQILMVLKEGDVCLNRITDQRGQP